MQVSHLRLPITKRLHYFYDKQAKFNFSIYQIYSILIISTLCLKILSLIQLKPINHYKLTYNNYTRSVLLRLKVS